MKRILVLIALLSTHFVSGQRLTIGPGQERPSLNGTYNVRIDPITRYLLLRPKTGADLRVKVDSSDVTGWTSKFVNIRSEIAGKAGLAEFQSLYQFSLGLQSAVLLRPTFNEANLLYKPFGYSPPLATATTPGLVKGSENVGIDPDGTIRVTAPGSQTLADVNPNPGTVGSGVSVPVVTYDTKGRATAVGSAPITPSGIGAASLVELLLKTDVLSVAQLRSTSTLSQYVNITDAGKQGTFYYDPTDSTTPDDGVLTIVSAGKRYKLVFTGPLDANRFGATGLGIGDDAASILAALNAYPDVTLKAGATYSISRLVIPAGRHLIVPKGTTIVGRVLTSAQISEYGAEFGIIQLLSGASLTGEGTIEGNKANRPQGYGIFFANTGSTVPINISGLRIRNVAGDAVRFQAVTGGVNISGLDIRGCVDRGIHGITTSDVNVRGNRIEGGTHGIQWYGIPSAYIERWAVLGNDVSNVSGGGIWGYCLRGGTIAGGSSVESDDINYDLERCENVVVSGIFSKNGLNSGLGIYNGCKNIEFAGCQVIQEAGQGPGLRLYAPNDGNTAKNSQIVLSGGALTCAPGVLSIIVDEAWSEDVRILGANITGFTNDFIDCDRVQVKNSTFTTYGPIGLSNLGGKNGVIENNTFYFAGTGAASEIKLIYRSAAYPATGNLIQNNRAFGYTAGIIDDPGTGSLSSSGNVFVSNLTGVAVSSSRAGYSLRVVNNYRADGLLLGAGYGSGSGGTTTDASSLTAGILPDARLSGNIARQADITTATAPIATSVSQQAAINATQSGQIGSLSATSGTLTSGLSSVSTTANSKVAQTEFNNFTSTQGTFNNSLNTANVTNANSITSIQAVNATQTTNINSVSATNATQTTQISSVSATNATQATDISSLSATVGTHTGQIASLSTAVGNINGSETKIQQGTNVTVTGTGTTGNPYVISSTASGSGGGSSNARPNEIFCFTPTVAGIQTAINSATAVGTTVVLAFNLCTFGDAQALIVENKQQFTLDLNRAVLRAYLSRTMIYLRGANNYDVRITGGSIQNLSPELPYNGTYGYYATITSQEDYKVDYLRLDHLDCTLPNAPDDFILFVTYRDISNNPGGTCIMRHISIDHNKARNIGRMFYESINGGAKYGDFTVRNYDVNFSDNDLVNIGVKVRSNGEVYGMGVSQDGHTDGIVIRNNRIRNAREVGIEIVNGRNFVVDGNIVIDDSTGWPGCNGISITDNRRFLTEQGTVTSNTIDVYQKPLVLREATEILVTGNKFKGTQGSDVIVRYSKFTGNHFWAIQPTSAVFYMHPSGDNGQFWCSRFNTISSNTFTNANGTRLNGYGGATNCLWLQGGSRSNTVTDNLLIYDPLINQGSFPAFQATDGSEPEFNTYVNNPAYPGESRKAYN